MGVLSQWRRTGRSGMGVLSQFGSQSSASVVRPIASQNTARHCGHASLVAQFGSQSSASVVTPRDRSQKFRPRPDRASARLIVSPCLSVSLR